MGYGESGGVEGVDEVMNYLAELQADGGRYLRISKEGKLGQTANWGISFDGTSYKNRRIHTEPLEFNAKFRSNFNLESG